MKKHETDVLVIGAGPAGSIAAAMIHKAGYNVMVVEREKFPRFVIGESLLPRCMEVLSDAELLEAVKREKFQEKFGAKFMRGENEVADYNFADQFTKGWNWTWQVPRASFDLALATEVAAKGVPVSFETTVTDIKIMDDESSITTVQTKEGITEEIAAKFIVDASGYGRVIPRLFKLDKPSSLDPRKALFAHLADPNRDNFDEPNRIIIVSYAPGTWVWVIPFSNGNTSVGFVGSHDFFEQYKGSIEEQYNTLIEDHPYLRKRFGSATRIFEPRKLESWSSISEKFHGKGYVLTGNVTEFLDPIFSSGVMFATVSSHLASKLVIRKLDGKEVEWEKDYTHVLQSGVDTFRAFVTAWYDGTLEKIFYTKNPDPLIKRQICSVLAGYVWDLENPFVKEPTVALKRLVKYIDVREKFAPQS
ncbi:NAD(P)/FAD-dependent oxidoreductase [Pseudochryseolinea flava]|uniref:Pyridine nucleotide-disulfide oxidoreductase n=1 Tax=Pseudochryseolinea flava TaxID=2059302 RepID=A0A364Y0G3_9BACT|nr:NAD(P)/FAD-dependent oxidoreductase [Pseudochryseolinea flava]RAW00145.1 pyridine nucleotide-disulfide oxidoreductase [Pseudochryseolinea flava]